MQDKPPRRKAVNVTLDAALLAEARAADVNLSAVLEAALRERMRGERQRRWRDENKVALAAYDRHIEQDGLWHDEFRTW